MLSSWKNACIWPRNNWENFHLQIHRYLCVCVILWLGCTPTRIARAVHPEVYTKLIQDTMLETGKFTLK